ncbi:putative TIM-barrel fold metal-dependent hydrolase [Variovorax boronicumulans]|uniref:TIM-barrel fold metal-dependent hydrolase n=1 Tax=Variovorax boronicumulans TaxID=436515 RepID=A0AAW8D4C3_9BURK|nr:amidohydrolase family protein [Variovorax boronicumulans]MDP9894852.1 putative TIM-barrel fold metal-dependent hydrolase [Variovorax boronicumulans]MDQ0054828.1 putative TIM-barrel fold metal-dependent hydrolase [Variovorax boronicumulans]
MTTRSPHHSRLVSAVDSHAHVFRRELAFVDGRRYSPDFDALLGDYLGLLDANGVSHALLVQPSFLGTDNAFLLAALQADPERLRGVAVVDPSATDAELRWLATRGVCGIRLNLVGTAAPDLRKGAWVDLLQRVRALHWHVEIHLELAALPPVGQAVIDIGCRLVVDHFGRPGAADGEGWTWLLHAAQTGQVWVKLSAAYRNWPPSAQGRAAVVATKLLEAFGPEHLLWGSDWPHTQHRDFASFPSALAALHAWVPDAAARQTILVDTPCRLFQFL